MTQISYGSMSLEHPDVRIHDAFHGLIHKEDIEGYLNERKSFFETPLIRAETDIAARKLVQTLAVCIHNLAPYGERLTLQKRMPGFLPKSRRLWISLIVSRFFYRPCLLILKPMDV